MVHTYACSYQGDQACSPPPRQIKCSEIASEAIFSSKQPPEQIFQYIDHRFTEGKSEQGRPSINVTFHVICLPQMYESALAGSCTGVHRRVANLSNATNAMLQVEKVAMDRKVGP